MLSNDFPPRQPFVHRLCTKKSLLSTSYPLCFPHSVENYTRVIHPQQVDNKTETQKAGPARKQNRLS